MTPSLVEQQRLLGRKLAVVSFKWALSAVAVFVLASGVVAALVLSAALVLDLLGFSWALRLAPPVLSVLGAVGAFYLVFVHLNRGLGGLRQAIRIEESCSGTGLLLTAAEFSSAEGGRPAGVSEELLSSAISRGTAFLDSIPPRALLPLRQIVLLSWAMLAGVALLVVLLTVSPGARLSLLRAVGLERRAASAGALQKTPAGQPADGAGQELLQPEKAVPCLRLTVEAIDPEYLGSGVHQLTLNGHFSLYKGSRLRFRCAVAPRVAAVSLDRRDEQGVRVTEAFALVSSTEGQRVFEKEIVFSANEELRLFRPLEAGGRVWHQGLWVLHELRDHDPECWLLKPDGQRILRPGDRLYVSADARDDLGIARVLLRYRVQEIDEEFLDYELSVEDGARDVRLEEQILLEAFGVEAGQTLELFVEVQDNRAPSPGVCRSEKRLIVLRGADWEPENIVRGVSELRNLGLDLLADSIDSNNPRGLLDSMKQILLGDRLRACLGRFEAAGRLLNQTTLLEQDDLSRFAETRGRLDGLQEEREACWQSSGRKLRDCLVANTGKLSAALAEALPVMADVAENLLNSHVVRKMRELELLRRELGSLVLNPGAGERRRREARRNVARLRFHVDRLAELEADCRQSLPGPVLWGRAPTVGNGEGLLAKVGGDLAALLGQLEKNTDRAELVRALNLAEQAMDTLSRSAEGDYIRSVSRSIRGFRKRLTGLKLEYLKLQDRLRTAEEELGGLKAEVERRIESSVKLRRGRKGQELRRTTRLMLHDAAFLAPELYLPLEQQGVRDLPGLINSLHNALGGAQLEEAAALVAEIQEQLRSMSYSIELQLRYGHEGSRPLRSELLRVGGLLRSADLLHRETAELFPSNRGYFRPRDVAKLELLRQKNEELAKSQHSLETRLAALATVYPALYAKLEQIYGQTRKALSDYTEALGELDLDESLRLLAYASDSAASALAVLEDATRGGRKGSLVLAGGAAGSQAPMLKSLGQAPVSRINEMLEALPALGLEPDPEALVREYYRRLLK